MPVSPDNSAARVAATRASSDPRRMTQVQSAFDVVHLWAQGGAGSAHVIRGQMWWSPSEGRLSRVRMRDGGDGRVEHPANRVVLEARF